MWRFRDEMDPDVRPCKFEISKTVIPEASSSRRLDSSSTDHFFPMFIFYLTFTRSPSLTPHGPCVVDPVVQCEEAKVVRQHPILKLELDFIFVEPVDDIGLGALLPFLVLGIALHNLQEALIGMNADRVSTDAIVVDHWGPYPNYKYFIVLI